MNDKPRLLILSFSNIGSDARVVRQVAAFSADYSVTTCGYGLGVEGTPHIEITHRITAMEEKVRAALWHARSYRAAYWAVSQHRQARRLLSEQTFDILLANDLDAVGIALSVANPRRVHLDLHEYWVGVRDNEAGWNALRRPYYAWMLRHWATQIKSVTTISEGLAELYQQEFGIRCGVVPNACYYRDFLPTPVGDPIRLVHSGGTNVNRNLERLIEAVSLARANVSLDLILMGEGTAYHDSLVQLAATSNGRVRVLPSVPHSALVETLNQYDVGLPFFPPVTTNLRMTLPNKLFDFIQARLAIVTGPTMEIERIVAEYDLGLVTEDFTAESLANALDKLTHENVEKYKRNAASAAKPLAAEELQDDWLNAIAAIADRLGFPSKPTMIFHVPFVLGARGKSASGIRPMKMREAFSEAGFRVFEVSGSHAQRRRQIAALKRRMREGFKPDFVYSESTTTPTGLGEKVTRHTSVTRDLEFLRFCKDHGVPVGLFYRDIYWQFPQFGAALNAVWRRVMISRYRADLRAYRRAVDTLFVPSAEMATQLESFELPPMVALPPGLTQEDTKGLGPGLQLVYVGGLGAHYEMQEALKGVALARDLGADATMVICTREEEWVEVRSEYADLLGSSTSITHLSGAELSELLGSSTLGSLFVRPSAYREFAVPMKLFEYLGHGLPVVASEGTLSGEFVKDNGLGWTIPYGAQELAELLRELEAHPERLDEKRAVVAALAPKHTWKQRALEVSRVLSDRHVGT